MSTNPNHFTMQTIEGCFVIPSYQRGYRWTPNDAEKLLDDLIQCSTMQYCLQPLELQTIKDTSNGSVTNMRVIDGQQRLTTLYLIARALNINNNSPKWDIFYETEDKRISDIWEEDSNSSNQSEHKTINDDFRDKVKNMIIEFLKDEEHQKAIRPFFEGEKEIILLTHFVDEDNTTNGRLEKGQDVFNRLNAGKTPLTSTELIRALYMVNSSMLGEQAKIEISKEWETMENTLNKDDFWVMFETKGLRDTPTRVDLLFALVLTAMNMGTIKEDEAKSSTLLEREKTNPKSIYEELESIVKEKKISLKEIWYRVLRCFWWMQSCYDDIELYNYLGWIKETTKYRASSIYCKFLRYPSIDHFKKAVIGIIRESIINYQGVLDPNNKENRICIRYGNPHSKDLLLLLNILSSNKQKERFRFDLLGFYDIEHIDSQTPNDLSDPETKKEWMESILLENILVKGIKNEEEAKKRAEEIINGGGFDEFVKNYSNYCKDKGILLKDDEKDSIGNLALLNQEINRSYKNAIFPQKRKRIIDAIIEGSQYIPVCTSKAFMKFYTKDVSEITCWTHNDYKSYEKSMNILLNDFLGLDCSLSKDQFHSVYISKSDSSGKGVQREDSSSENNRRDTAYKSINKFEALLDEYSICIPKIQRLYVQGRKDSRGKSCLQAFASALINSVTENAPLSLDMIYGIYSNGTFQPLDGQQRLTTLLLLAWILGIPQNKVNKWSFKYESRRSTELFIDNLLNTPAINRISKEEYNQKYESKTKHIKNSRKKPDYLPLCREYIKKTDWFLPVWERDSGINGMLEMLDSLYCKLCSHDNQTNRLLNLDSISFSINYLDVSDCLYDQIFLKMNSRGRELTLWDNVKAILDKHVPEKDTTWRKDIDTTWPQDLWDKIKIDEKKHVKINVLNDIILDLIASALKYAGYTSPVYNTFELDTWFENQEEKNANNIYQFFSCASDLLSMFSINDFYSISPKFWPNYNKTIIFDKTSNLYKHLCVFFALKRFSGCKEDQADWMRIVWNIVENSQITDIESFVKALKLLTELLDKTNSGKNILTCLAQGYDSENNSVKAGFIKIDFSREQILEECQKAYQIVQDIAFKELILDAEQNLFFFGCIRFLFRDSSNMPSWKDFDNKLKVCKSFFRPQDNSWLVNNISSLAHDYISNAIAFEQIYNKRLFNNNYMVWKSIFEDPGCAYPVHCLLTCQKQNKPSSDGRLEWAKKIPCDYVCLNNPESRLFYYSGYRLALYKSYSRASCDFLYFEARDSFLRNNKNIVVDASCIVGDLYSGWDIVFCVSSDCQIDNKSYQKGKKYIYKSDGNMEYTDSI